MEATVRQSPEWQNARRYLRYFAWFIFASIAGGIVAGHVPILFLGKNWSTCLVSGDELGCLIMVHFWGVLLVAFTAFFAWYALKRFSPDTGHQTRALLMMTIAIDLVYFAFQTGLVLDSIRREGTSAEPWETWVLGILAVVIAIGIGFGIVVHQKLVKALFPN